jgi:hypothetical protein
MQSRKWHSSGVLSPVLVQFEKKRILRCKRCCHTRLNVLVSASLNISRAGCSIVLRLPRAATIGCNLDIAIKIFLMRSLGFSPADGLGTCIVVLASKRVLRWEEFSVNQNFLTGAPVTLKVKTECHFPQQPRRRSIPGYAS